MEQTSDGMKDIIVISDKVRSTSVKDSCNNNKFLSFFIPKNARIIENISTTVTEVIYQVGQTITPIEYNYIQSIILITWLKPPYSTSCIACF